MQDPALKTHLNREIKWEVRIGGLCDAAASDIRTPGRQVRRHRLAASSRQLAIHDNSHPKFSALLFVFIVLCN